MVMTRSFTGWLARSVSLGGIALFATILGAHGFTYLVSTLGISAYTAGKIVDILLAAWSISGIIGAIIALVGSDGIGIGVLAAAKALAKRYGKDYAKAW